MTSVSWSSFSTLFSKGSASYAKFRPEYPAALYQHILQYAALPAQDLAVDIATGSGQAAKDLSKHFRHVIALDSSPDQLKHAAKLANVSFRQGAAETSGLEGGIADLAAVAQALHWFDLSKFYPEARRILKPNGTLAIWGYDTPRFPTKDAANALFQTFYTSTMGPYWSKRRRHIDNHYTELEPSPEIFSDVHRLETEMQKDMDLDQLIGYLSSWSAYNTFKAQHPDRPDPLLKFKQDFATAANFGAADSQITVAFPIFALLCSNKTS